MARHPAYKDSTLVQNAAVASRLIVTTTGFLASALTQGADNFTKKTKPNPKPMTFTPATQERVRKLNSLTEGAAGLSAKTVGQVTKVAQNIGATLARRGESQKGKNRGFDKEGKPIENYKPGLLNKSMMAFSTVADGVDHASRNLLASGSTAATTVVGHRYGEDARKLAGGLAGGVKNVGLVYIDASGVSRRAIIKSVAKGMVRLPFSLPPFLSQPSRPSQSNENKKVVGKAPSGANLIIGGGDGGYIPPELRPQDPTVLNATVGNNNLIGSGQVGPSVPGVGEVGFGNSAPPAASGALGSVGEPLGTQGLQGQDVKIAYR